ncbi:MAG: hypothetical protein MI974_26295 [Chitinophagales bacterium]|nr:hypothetical protein [Chitinophagales bacterium]
MTNTIKFPIAIACVFIWIGFVGAISFMEAWLKFRAPGITLSLGLGIGRLVFNALNKVEIVLSIAIIVSMLIYGLPELRWKYLFFLIPFLILIVQSIWLLPMLDARAEMHLQNMEVPASNLHFYYVGLECVKISCLAVFGIKLFN